MSLEQSFRVPAPYSAGAASYEKLCKTIEVKPKDGLKNETVICYDYI